jgi:hypothetical protein
MEPASDPRRRQAPGTQTTTVRFTVEDRALLERLKARTGQTAMGVLRAGMRELAIRLEVPHLSPTEARELAEAVGNQV